MLHPYRWDDGSIAVVVVRFPTPAGKEARRMSWDAGRSSWRWGGTAGDAPVPLYRLPELLVRPDAPILLCEGEKTADAVPGIDWLRDYVGAAVLGGSNPAEGTDWNVVAGRLVVVLGDYDAQGNRFRLKVAKFCYEAGATVTMLKPPDVWRAMGGEGKPPRAWDIADGIPDCGCGADAMLQQAAEEWSKANRNTDPARVEWRRDIARSRVEDALTAVAVCRTPEIHADRLTRAHQVAGDDNGQR